MAGIGASSFRLQGRGWLWCVIIGVILFEFFCVEGADLQWQHPVPRDGDFASRSFQSGDVFQFWWFSPYIPQSEQRLASWPGRFPEAGDHTLIDDVVDTDSDSEDLDTEDSYTVTLTQDLVRCQQLTIGGSYKQELAVETEGDITVGYIGTTRVCANTRSFGPGVREGKRGDNLVYLAARDTNEDSLGAGSGGDPGYWVVSVTFGGDEVEDFTTTETDHEDGTYTIAYRAPGVCGSAVLFIGCGSLSINIPGSPFQINFFDCDPPPVESATISRNGVQLEILFEYGTDYGGFDGSGFDCRDLLDYPRGLFGEPSEVYCYWRLPELLILVFGTRARVLPGDTFILLGNFIRGAPPLQTPTLNETLVTVTMYEDSDIPRLHICGPEIVPNCIEKVAFEASSSRGTGGREYIYDVNSVGIGMFDDTDTDDDDVGETDLQPSDVDSDGVLECVDADSSGRCDDPDFYWMNNPDYTKRYTTLTPIQWSLLAPSAGDDYVASILADLTDDNYYELEFEVDRLQEEIEYVFLAQATNYLGQYSSALHSFTITRNETSPVAHIYAPTTVQMYRSSPLMLLCEGMEMCDASILVSNRTRLDYYWTVTTDAYDDDSSGFVPIGSNNGVPEYAVSDVFASSNVQGDSPVLNIPAYDMTFGFDYTYTCYVSIGEGAPETGRGSDSVQVEIVSAPLQPCAVDGATRSVYSEYEFLMDGSCSIDPNGENENSPLEYQWCCIKQTFPFEGQACDNTAFPLGGECSDFSPDIPARSFNSQARQFQTGEYLFTLNLRQGERTASYEVRITIVSDSIPTVHTDELETYFVDTTSPLLLKGYLESAFVSSAVNNIDLQYWTVDPPYFDLDDDATLSDCGVNCSYLYLPANILTQGVRFDFTYHFRENGLESESWAGITVITKENPQGGFCSVESIDPEESPTTNRDAKCFEYEADLDVQYVDYYFLDPLIDQEPYPRLLVSPVMCARPLLIPSGTHTLFSKLINGVSARVIGTSFEETQRPEYDFDDIRGVIDTLQLQSGLMGRYNNFLQVSFFLLNMVNYKLSYYEPDGVDGFPNYVCLPLDNNEQVHLSLLREQIFLSFSTLFVFENKDIYFFENLAYMVDSTVSPCSIRRTQFVDLQVMVYLSEFNLLQDIQLFRQTDLAGTLFAKGMEDILLNIQNTNTTWFAYSECTRAGGKVWEFLQALSLSYMIDGVVGVYPSCVQWDRVWFCDFKDVLSDDEIPPRQSFSYRAVQYLLPDEIINNLEVEDGGDIFDVVLLTSDYQPDECRHPLQSVSTFSDFNLKVDLGVTDFTIERLKEPIRVTLPLVLEEGELASEPYPAYFDVDDETFRTDGLELVETSYQYPGFFYQGFSIFTTDHATSFAMIQDIPEPDEYDTDTPKIELWWFVVFAFSFLLLVFICVFVPLMYGEYKEKKQAAYEFPQPPPNSAMAGVQMEQMGGGEDFGAWDEEGDEFFDEDEEYYEDGDYDEEDE